MTDEQVARLRELAERARKPQGWKRIAFQAARLDEFREAASPDVVIRLLDELDRLRHENHNLNWALDTDGYEQMYTEAERVEHADAVARITEHLDRLAARKARLDALVPAGVDILDHIDALRRERDEALDTLEDMVGQHCHMDDYLDSLALSANARAMRLLARHHRLTIDAEYGRRVIARQTPDGPGHDAPAAPPPPAAAPTVTDAMVEAAITAMDDVYSAHPAGQRPEITDQDRAAMRAAIDAALAAREGR